jgi:transcriptional regulator with XRE-family HTH domain
MSKEITQQNKTNWTKEQVHYMTILSDPTDKRTDEAIAEEVGVNRTTLWAWRQKDGFLDESYRMLEKNAKSQFNKVFAALVSKAEAGDTSAMRLMFEVMGKTKDKGGPTVNVVIPLLGGDSHKEYIEEEDDIS